MLFLYEYTFPRLYILAEISANIQNPIALLPNLISFILSRNEQGPNLAIVELIKGVGKNENRKFSVIFCCLADEWGLSYYYYYHTRTHISENDEGIEIHV